MQFINRRSAKFILTITDVLDYWQNWWFHLLQEEDEQQRVRVRRQHGCFNVVNFAELMEQQISVPHFDQRSIKLPWPSV
jgi:hypothetical protein